MLKTTGVTRLINRSQTFTGCSSSSSSRILLEPKTNPFIPRVANHSTTVSQPYRSTPAPTIHWIVGMSCCCFATCSVVYECKQRVEHRLPSHQKVVVRLRNSPGYAISVSTAGALSLPSVVLVHSDFNSFPPVPFRHFRLLGFLQKHGEARGFRIPFFPDASLPLIPNDGHSRSLSLRSVYSLNTGRTLHFLHPSVCELVTNIHP